MMKKTALALAMLAASAGVFAQSYDSDEVPDGNWMIRLRGVHLNSANKDHTDNGLGGNNGLRINNKWLPEVDVTYFFTPNVAVEGVLTWPQKHRVTYLDQTSSTRQDLGSLKELPPTLMLQYHFTDIASGAIKPYVGIGMNYTRFSSVDLGGASVKRNSVGMALQAGVDFAVTKGFSLNLDVKKVWMSTNVMDYQGTDLGTFKIDPVLFGVGFGYRF